MDEAALFEALQRAPTRSAEVLARVCLDGWPLAQLASRYGVSDEAAARLLLRSTRDLERAARGEQRPAPPLPDADAGAQAAQLVKALGGEPPAESIQGPAALLTALATHAVGLQRRRREAEEAAASAPARRRETWLRRALIIAVLAVGGWLYWRDRQAPPSPPAHREAPEAR